MMTEQSNQDEAIGVDPSVVGTSPIGSGSGGGLMSEQPNQDQRTIGADPPTVSDDPAAEDDYRIGRGRPPEEYRWKKGQSGNPRGRPRKKPDKKAILEHVLNECVAIREDGKERKVAKIDAVYRAQVARAMKGDPRAAKLILDEAARLGIGAEENGGVFALPPSQIQPAWSDALFADLNTDLLSEDEMIELARYGKIIELGGDFTALSLRDFERAQQIANKGHGKDITPRA